MEIFNGGKSNSSKQKQMKFFFKSDKQKVELTENNKTDSVVKVNVNKMNQKKKPNEQNKQIVKPQSEIKIIANKQKSSKADKEIEQNTVSNEKYKSLKVSFLGGVGEIGKNLTVIEYGDNILIVDCGLCFPTAETPGVDLIVPDFTYLESKKDKIRGLVLTHGHEDHIGAVPLFTKSYPNVPICGSGLTLALVDHKLEERKITKPKTIKAEGGSVIKLGCFEIEFIKVTHSITGAFALAITTPSGVIFHTGDYKIDYTPIDGEAIDLTRIAQIGNRGVKLMLGESTNVEREGFTISERKVGNTLERAFIENDDKRIIIATFASNIHRLQQITDVAIKQGRKVAFNGRSMKNISEMAMKLGILTVDPKYLIEVENAYKYPPRQVCIITTGSQGEPMSGLTRMASGEDKICVDHNDLVVISSQPIPGNEKLVYTVINNLYRRGASVLYGSLEALHVSGHACKEELKLMLSLVKPQYFIPVHGEYRHLKQHKELALSMGMSEKSVAIAEIGNCYEIKKKGLYKLNDVPSGNVYVDGIGDVDTLILNDRKQMSNDGVIIMLITIDKEKKLATTPEIIARGVMLSESFVNDLRRQIAAKVDALNFANEDKSGYKNAIKRNVTRFIMNKLRQKPMVLPIITEV